MVQNRLLQKLFKNRGIDPDEFRKYDDPSHGLPVDTDELCTKLHKYEGTGETVTILTDFDMDGIMSCVIAMAALGELGISAVAYVPNPCEGYGFDASTIDDLVRSVPSTKAVLTGDVGVSCFDGINRCKDLGVEILVTDHHSQAKVLPDADCLVNPMRHDDSYEHPEICGAYVMYQVMQRYADLYHDIPKQEQIRRLRVFAGIGTVSDYMPVLYENRQLLRDAISICRMVYSDGSNFFVDLIEKSQAVSHCYKQVFRGLRAVLAKLEQEKKLSSAYDIDETLFGYYIAPMFNSVKRIGSWDDMRMLYGIFFGNPQDTGDLVNYLWEMNVRRKDMVAVYMDEIHKSVQHFKPFVYFTDAPAGICGLLAQNLSSENGGPVCVVRQDESLHGSGRSPSWYPFLERVGDSVYAAGHEGAFGIGFKSVQEIADFCKFLRKDVDTVIGSVSEHEITSKPDFVIACDDSGDTMVDILLFLEYLDELKPYRPFGQGFPAPDIELRFYPSDGIWSTLSDGKHLKIILPHGLEVLVWNKADEISRQDGIERLTMRGRLEENVFNGNHKVQFVGDFV